MYTGSGKTRCGLRAYEASGKKSTLVITSRVPLIAQWKNILQGWNVDYMCIQSAYKHKGHYDLVIIDEVHKALSPAYRKVFSGITSNKLLCLTATLPEDPEYVEFLNHICPVVYTKTLASALDEGKVPKFEILNVPVFIHTSVLGKYTLFDNKFTKATIQLTRFRMDRPTLWNKYPSVFDLAKGEKDSKDKEVASVAKSYWAAMTMRKQILYNNPAKIPAVIQILRNNPHRKWVLFCKTKVFAETLKSAIHEKLGITASMYHSGQHALTRLENLRAFEKGHTKILVAVDALNEGLDVKGVDAAICVAGVSTTLTNYQQLGRIIRPEGDKEPLFINLYTQDTVEKGWLEKKQRKTNLEVKWLKSPADIVPRQYVTLSNPEDERFPPI